MDFKAFRQTEWRGFFASDCVMVSNLHPSKITVSAGALDFAYTVGGKEVVRTFGLTKSADGKITSFTNPDGTITEVLRDG